MDERPRDVAEGSEPGTADNPEPAPPARDADPAPPAMPEVGGEPRVVTHPSRLDTRAPRRDLTPSEALRLAADGPSALRRRRDA